MDGNDASKQAALSYAKRGWLVFPVSGIRENGVCTCPKGAACTSPGKHPLESLVPHGLLEATTAAAQIEDWWTKRPSASVAIRTGAESGLVVIDIDDRHGGDVTIMNLQCEYGLLPPTFTVTTGGGGAHYFFKHPGIPIRSRVNVLGTGVDVRADGGYVVAPPSRHVSGNVYAWDEDLGPDSGGQAADIPPWVLVRLLDDRAIQVEREPDTGDRIITEPGRNNALTQEAGVLRRRGYSEGQVLDGLRYINERWVRPPLPDKEVEHIAHESGKWSQGKPGISSYTPPQVEQQSGLVTLSDLVEEPEEQLDWLVDGLLLRGGLSLVTAKPKVGKSVLARNLVMAMAAGWGTFLGRDCKPGKVVYLGLEEHRTAVRIHFQKMGATRAVVGDRARVWVGLGPHDGLQWLNWMITEYAPDLLIFDPFQSLLRIANLNDYSEVKKILDIVMAMARAAGVHIMIVHHNNKMTLAALGDSVLGSTAFFAAPDVLIGMESQNGIRVVRSINRYGDDLDELVVIHDKETGLIRMGSSIVERKFELMLDEVFSFITDGLVLSAAVVIQKSGLGKSDVYSALSSLVELGKLERIGTKPPFSYRRSAVQPTTTQESFDFVGLMLRNGVTIEELDEGEPL